MTKPDWYCADRDKVGALRAGGGAPAAQAANDRAHLALEQAQDPVLDKVDRTLRLLEVELMVQIGRLPEPRRDVEQIQDGHKMILGQVAMGGFRRLST